MRLELKWPTKHELREGGELIMRIAMLSMLGLLDYTSLSFDISHVITIEPTIILKMPLVYCFK
jgi:hypothetical protein